MECLEAGVFRADIPAKFQLIPSALQGLIDKIDRDLTFTLEVEHGMRCLCVVYTDNCVISSDTSLICVVLVLFPVLTVPFQLIHLWYMCSPFTDTSLIYVTLLLCMLINVSIHLIHRYVKIRCC